VGWKYTFLVPGEVDARALVEAFAEFGFPLIMAGPYRPNRYVTDPDAGADDWDVTVFDAEPEAASEHSERQRHAVRQAARALARRYGGFLRTSMAFPAGQAGSMTGTRNAAVVLRQPGARPAVPEAPLPPAPALASLAFEVTAPRGTSIDLDGLFDVSWAELAHAHGSAADVPGLIEALAEGFGDWTQVLEELIGDDILHQGSCYPATAPAMPFLARLITSDALPFYQQLDVYEVLLDAATRHAASLVADADRAAARQRPPRPAAWSADVHEAVGTCVPGLLERWQLEPEPLRVVLTVFAALYPDHGVVAADLIRAMSAKHPNTDAGALLDLCLSLIDGNAELAEQQARGLADRHVHESPLDAPGLPITTRVAGLLTLTASRCTRRRRTSA
jgi:hypothetical protein